jgi:signal transduction histidine kinase
VELAIVGRSGHRVPVLASAAPVRAADGALQGAVTVFQDITPLKHLERLREEWTAVVAHDLRQPINAIALHAQVLARARGDAKRIGESTDQIVAATARLDRMVGDLLDASRVEANRLGVRLRPTQLEELVRGILDRARGATKGHPVALDVRGRLPVVSADAERVEQVLANLLSNAAKYGAEGTEIVVTLEEVLEGARVSVTNRGEPLAPDEISRLFSRFYRTPKAERSAVVGLGLGLYISKGLVEAQGGRMWAASDSEGTNAFHFTLRRAEALAVGGGARASGE